jgi:hypothetical protein
MLATEILDQCKRSKKRATFSNNKQHKQPSIISETGGAMWLKSNFGPTDDNHL